MGIVHLVVQRLASVKKYAYSWSMKQPFWDNSYKCHFDSTHIGCQPLDDFLLRKQKNNWAYCYLTFIQTCSVSTLDAQSKYLSIRNDYAFKKVFGSPENEDIVINFINDILQLVGDDKIKNVTFLNSSQNPNIASQKQSVIDVLCLDQMGITTIIEMQVAKTKSFEKRAQYYVAKSYANQVGVGENYDTLKKINFIAIADFVLFPNKDSYMSNHVTIDKFTSTHELKDFNFTFIELPKFHNKKNELVNMADKWIYFLKHSDKLSEKDVSELKESNPVIGKACNELLQFNWNKDELLLYEQADKHSKDLLSCLQEKYDQGKEEGKEEGNKLARIAVAENLLQANVEIHLIADYTGLPQKDIKELENKIRKTSKVNKLQKEMS